MYALVRWYDPAPRLAQVHKRRRGDGADKPDVVSARDVLAEHGYTKLWWAKGHQLRGATVSEPQYTVIAMSSIVRREYVVPDFATWVAGSQPQFFYVSKAKWDRLPKDETTSVKYPMYPQHLIYSGNV